MRRAPCKDCPRREVGCHTKCRDYIDWKADWDKFQEEQKRKRQAIQQLIEDTNRIYRKRR